MPEADEAAGHVNDILIEVVSVKVLVIAVSAHVEGVGVLVEVRSLSDQDIFVAGISAPVLVRIIKVKPAHDLLTFEFNHVAKESKIGVQI